MTNYDYGCLVGGAWQDDAATPFETFNPARPRDRVGTYRPASPEQIAEAVERAAQAQKDWRKVPVTERIRICTAFFAAIARRSEDIALSITLEQGKPLTESRNETAKSLGEAAAMTAHVLSGGAERMADARPGFQNMVARRPRGVIAAITPWNFPILTPMRKIAPALLYGNAIIIKPSEFTPATVCLIGEAANETLPAGLFQIALGGGDVGAALVAAAGIAGITFTGSVATGKRIYALGAGNLAELSLELGGKSPSIVYPDADEDWAVDGIIAAMRFTRQSQSCTAGSRLFLHEDIFDSFLAKLEKKTSALKIGDPLDEKTDIGTIINNNSRKRKRTCSKPSLEPLKTLFLGKKLRPFKRSIHHRINQILFLLSIYNKSLNSGFRRQLGRIYFTHHTTKPI